MEQAAVAPVGAQKSFFPTLISCVGLSIGLLVAASLMSLPPIAAMVSGVLPLIYYHVYYLKPRAAEGLSPAAVDSVYYFGFLVTIAALGLSALHIAQGSGGQDPLQHIAAQFGLGLMATGYAVVARIHLTSLSAIAEEGGAEAALDKYLLRTRELVYNVELSSTEFVNLANNLMAKSEQVTQQASETLERSMLGMARQFDEEMRKALASGLDGLTELRGLVADATFAQEREQLRKSVKDTVETIEGLNTALKELATQAGEGAKATEAITQGNVRLSTQLHEMATAVEEVAGPQGSVPQAALRMAAATDTITNAVLPMAGVIESLKDAASQSTSTGSSLKTIRTLSERAGEQVNALSKAATGLEEATTQLVKSAGATTTLATSVQQAAAAVPTLTEGIAALNQQISATTSGTAQLRSNLDTLPKATEVLKAVSAELSDAMGGVRELLTQATNETKGLADNANATAKSVEVTQAMLRAAQYLEQATEKVHNALEKVSSSVERLDSAIAGSTEKLNTSLGRAAHALDQDVTRSSKAASMFVEKLTDTAQVILDNTRAPRMQ